MLNSPDPDSPPAAGATAVLPLRSNEIPIIGLRELRETWPAIEERLRQGHPHVITNHGKAVAVLAPMTSSVPFSAEELRDLSVRLIFQASRMPR